MRFPSRVSRLAPLLCLLLLLLTPPRSFADPASDRDLAQALQPFIDNGTVSGAVTLVADDQQILHHAASGYSDLATSRPMHPQDLFWIASMTKPITAVCVLMLVEEGRLSIDDPVEKFIPSFRSQSVAESPEAHRRPPVRPMTVRDLLIHKSGISEVRQGIEEISLADLVDTYGNAPLRFDPGTRWAYSTAGINTLGRLVEVISGKAFEQFLQERLLDPLEMHDTTFWPSPEQAARLAKSYASPKGATQLQETSIGMLPGTVTNRKRPPTPGAGLFSTARDVAHFYQLMLGRGQFRGKQLLKAKTVEDLISSQTEIIPTPSAPGVTMGLGFKVQTEPQEATAMQAPGTFGHGGAYGTQSWADPKHHLICILLVQRAGMPKGDGSDIRSAFQEAAYAAFVAPKN